MSMSIGGIICNMEERPTYASWLKKRRLTMGLTQQALADVSGLHRTYIVRLEKPGHIDLPALETRQRIHAALGTTEDELIALGIVRSGVRVPLQRVALPPTDADTFIASLTPEQRALLRRMLDDADRPHPEDAADVGSRPDPRAPIPDPQRQRQS